MSNTTTSTGEKYEGETGEVQDVRPRPRRARRAPTDAERAERDRVLAERAELRRAETAALRALDPAHETEDDPPVVRRKPARMGGEPNGLLLDLPRLSGRGLPGSRLVVAARSYDGAGPNGGKAHDYVTVFVVFHDGSGSKWRTVGVTIHRSELRDVAFVLFECADELDAHDAERAQ